MIKLPDLNLSQRTAEGVPLDNGCVYVLYDWGPIATRWIPAHLAKREATVEAHALRGSAQDERAYRDMLLAKPIIAKVLIRTPRVTWGSPSQVQSDILAAIGAHARDHGVQC